MSDGIVSGPVDLDRRRPRYRTTTLVTGLMVTHRGSGVVGSVSSWGKGQVVLRDRRGAVHRLPLEDGGFELDGHACTLAPPAPTRASAAPGRTASGSVALAAAPARVARASRLLVEGVHDAELVERVWGDDLRHEGVVVEPIDGIDHLADIIASFRPGPGRRLGVLVDHLVTGSKEQRLADAVHQAGVLVRGHRFVDVWEAIDPRVIGVAQWPQIPRDEPWKDGICRRLGVGEPGPFWKRLVNSVRSYADLDPSLVGAVEELIDFVTDPG